jgi:cytochrome c553
MRTTQTLVGTVALLLALGWSTGAVAGPLDARGASKSLTCSACHGFAGQSPSATVPILAGMSADYFKKAIQDYAAGRRPSTEMEPYAKAVIQAGLDDVAAYFSGQKREPTAITVDPAAAARGKTAAVQCALCHGPDGRGDSAKGVPDLRGQPVGYLRNQMFLFKADRRSPADERLKPLKALMKTIPDETLADLAAYFSSVR